jgi:hypothetical protein
MEVVIDKSFVRASSEQELANLCANHVVLFTDSLLYEVLDNVRDRDQCFAKLPNGNDNFIFMQGVGPLIEYERKHGRPATPLSAHRMQGILSINRAFKKRSFDLSVYERMLLESKERVATDVRGFVELTTTINRLWPRIEGDQGYSAELVNQVSADPNIILRMYENVVSGTCASINETWVTFRWFQVQVIYCIQMFTRHQGKVIITKKLENDFHDLHYLIYASLSGAIATNDKKLQRNFCRLRQDGVVFST